MLSFQYICTFNCQAEKNVGLDRQFGDTMLQRHAIQKLHGEKSVAVLGANVVNCADIGVIQRGCRLRFALKAGKCLRVTADLRW